jgi:hypothetical protein
MDGRRAHPASDRMDRAPTIPPAVPHDQREHRPGGSAALTAGWAAALGVGWPLAMTLAIALEPAPADPTATVPAIVEVASLGLFLALVGTAVAAGLRHPAAAVTGLVTGLLATTFSITCPVSGHHAFGAWWVAQLGVVTTMLAVSTAALARSGR